MPIIVPTGVHVPTCSNRVSLVGVKLFLLRMCALHFKTGTLMMFSYLLFCEVYACHSGLDICVITMSNALSRLSMLRAAYTIRQRLFLVARGRKLLLSPVSYSW